MNNLSAISERVVGSAVSGALADLGRINLSVATSERDREEDPHHDVSQSRAAESSLDEAGFAENDALPILQNSTRF